MTTHLIHYVNVTILSNNKHYCSLKFPVKTITEGTTICKDINTNWRNPIEKPPFPIEYINPLTKAIDWVLHELYYEFNADKPFRITATIL